MSIVQALGLTKKFGALTAVDQLTLDVREGEIFALVGPDGAGKTTTMRLLTGLMDPTEGRSVVVGKDVAKHPDASPTATLLELAVALETGSAFSFTKLYELDHIEFVLAM